MTVGLEKILGLPARRSLILGLGGTPEKMHESCQYVIRSSRVTGQGMFLDCSFKLNGQRTFSHIQEFDASFLIFVGVRIIIIRLCTKRVICSSPVVLCVIEVYRKPNVGQCYYGVTQNRKNLFASCQHLFILFAILHLRRNQRANIIAKCHITSVPRVSGCSNVLC